MLFSAEGQISEHFPHALSKAADLNEACSDGIPETDQDQQNHENIIGEIGIDGLNNSEHDIEFLL